MTKSSFPAVDLAAWRKQVEAELKGVPFDKALVQTTPEGIVVPPLYVDTAGVDPGLPGAPPFTRGAHAAGAHAWAVCPHVGADAAAVREELDGGATALWIDATGSDLAAVRAALAVVPAELPVILDAGGDARATVALAEAAHGRRGLALAADPLGACARSGANPLSATGALAALAAASHGRIAVASSLPYHDAGADAAEELAFALSTGVAYLRVLGVDGAARLGFRLAVGRDTFAELCKLRALRVCWHKILAAAGAPAAPMAHLHAVSSSRTLSQRDPWVNMLRVTTQVFAAALGGADKITPLPFDAALAAPGGLGRRVARNTALVLGHESHLGRVVDAAGGSYYIEQLTDQLARAAWKHFQAIERGGGMAAALADGRVRAMCDASWARREAELVKRKQAITGVSEFANLGEQLPSRPAAAPVGGGLPVRRDAAPFEALRDQADALAAGGTRPRVLLTTLGPLAEHAARRSFAQAFFAAGGFETVKTGDAEIACLCGSDERYAAEAATTARDLAAAGMKHVLLAGKPGALEADLKAAGVTGFIYVGCDVVATLAHLMGTLRSTP